MSGLKRPSQADVLPFPAVSFSNGSPVKQVLNMHLATINVAQSYNRLD